MHVRKHLLRSLKVLLHLFMADFLCDSLVRNAVDAKQFRGVIVVVEDKFRIKLFYLAGDRASIPRSLSHGDHRAAGADPVSKSGDTADIGAAGDPAPGSA